MSYVVRAFLIGLLFVLGGCVYYLNPLCTDMIRNGDETDIDCGGDCNGCAIGDSCDSDADCEQSICVGGTCKPLPCDNGVKDADESDVDCGGATCRKCSGGRGCNAGSDCFSGNCVTPANRCFGLEVSFSEQMPYESGDKTYAIFSGDLDNDADIDIVAANEQASTLSVFMSTGTGTFTKLPMAFPTGDYPTGGTIADINNDGDADVITADYHGDSVSVLLGDGTGSLQPKRTYPTVDGGETSNLAVGDLNGDGLLDIVATNPIGSSISVFFTNPDGTLDNAENIAVGLVGSNPYSAAIADFNKDGKNDLAVADTRSAQLLVRLGNGDGTFQPEVAYAEGGAPPYIMTAHDMDLDGTLDLVVANRGGNNVSVLLGRPDGTFKKPVVSSTGMDTGPYSVAVADFNLDGVPDVVTGNFMSSTASVLLGLGNGAFDPPINAGPMGITTYGVTAGLFDADMKPDFATANASSNNMTVKINTSR